MNIDVAKHIGATVREVKDREHQGKPARVIVATRTYDTSIDDLWSAITTAERIKRWFLPITGELRLGGRYQLVGNAGGEITACEAPKHLAATWEIGGGVTWIDVRLTADGERTHLVLEHMAHVDPHWEQFGPGAVGIGWELGLLGLAEYLSAPDVVFTEADLMASERGKEMVRGASAGWCEADIASGTERSVATAAAKRTSVAYGGEPAPTEEAPARP